MAEVGDLIDEIWYGKLTTREHPCRIIKLGKVALNWRLLVPLPPPEIVNPRNMKEGRFLLATYAGPAGLQFQWLPVEAVDVPEEDLALLYQDHTECTNAVRGATCTRAGHPTARDLSTLWIAMQMEAKRVATGRLEDPYHEAYASAKSGESGTDRCGRMDRRAATDESLMMQEL